MSSSSTDVFIGIDIGTTTAKALVRTADHDRVGYAEAATPWRTYPDGRTETSPEALLSLSTQLIRQAVLSAEAAVGRLHVGGIAVSGMAECGVLIDASNHPVAPVLAWFDRRGQRQVDRVTTAHPEFPALFEGKTGLPWNCQASIAKLMWLLESGITIAPGARWLSVPEWIVFRLGGEHVREASLASRTGLIDQNSDDVWPDGLSVAALPPGLLPPEVPAGHCVGRVRCDAVPASAARAALTVAGHDHPVAALGVGAVRPHELFNSSGTADVVARSWPGRLSDEQRRILVYAGWSAGRHVLPDTTLLLAGVRGGLLLRRVLSALGADSPDARAALDRASLAITTLPPGLDVTGAGRTGNDVVIRLQDDVSPAALWAAAARYTAAQTRASLASIEGLVGPHRRAVAAGGWTRMSSVRAAKASAIEHLTFSPVTQPGVTGAALLAMYAASEGSVPISDFLARARRAIGPMAVAS
jgi:sugar (pentulose or hexulose) kinase